MPTKTKGETAREHSNITKVRAIEDNLIQTLYDAHQLRKNIEDTDDLDQEGDDVTFETIPY